MHQNSNAKFSSSGWHSFGFFFDGNLRLLRPDIKEKLQSGKKPQQSLRMLSVLAKVHMRILHSLFQARKQIHVLSNTHCLWWL